MDLGRGRRAVLNFLSSFGLTIVTFATALISSRLVLAEIGDERFGAFRSLYELFGYLSLLDGGLSITVRPLLAQALAKNLGGDVVALLNASKATFRFVMLVSMAVGFLATAMIHRFVPVSEEVVADLRLASFILAIGLLNTNFGPYRTLCEAMQRAFLTNLLLMAQSVCITITTMILCIRIPQWGISIQAFSIVIWVMFFNVVLAVLATRIKRTFDSTARSTLNTQWNFRDLLRSSRDSFVFMLSGRATLHSNSLILGYFVGQVDVTKLYATQRLYDVIQSQLFAVGNASWAAMAEIYHQHDHELFLRRIKQLIRLLLVMGISAVVPVVFFDQAFVSLWVGPDRFGGHPLSCVMAINTFALSFTVFSTWCLTGTGMLKSVLRLTIVSSAADVLATMFFTATLGRIGPVLGSCFVLCTISVPWHLRLLSVHFGLRSRDLLRSNLPLLVTGIAYSVLVGTLSRAVSVQGWTMLLLVLGIPTLSFLIISSALFLDADQRQILLRRFGPRK